MNKTLLSVVDKLQFICEKEVRIKRCCKIVIDKVVIDCQFVVGGEIDLLLMKMEIFKENKFNIFKRKV